MGLGFVLLIWFVFWLGVACFCSLVFGAFTWWLVRRAKRGPRIRAVVAVVVLPPIAVVCGLLGFLGYGFWCEAVRGVDVGMGEGFRVQLGSGYELAMIDTMEQAFIRGPSGEQFGFGSKRIGFDDRTVYFETQPDVFQLIEKATGQSSNNLSQEDLAMKLHALGAPSAQLRSPERVYSALRWEAKDLAAIPMILGVPALLAVSIASYVWKVWRNAQQPAATSHGA